MNILIFNSGSSSQSFKVYQYTEGNPSEVIASGKAKNVATKTQANSVIEWKIGVQSGSKVTDLPTHQIAHKKFWHC